MPARQNKTDLIGKRYVLSALWNHPSHASIRRGLEARGAQVFTQTEVMEKLTKSLEAFSGSEFAAIILMSADFPKEHLWLGGLLKCPVIAELDLANELVPTTFIAVTGTNGKTSTVEMLTTALQASGKNAEGIVNFERSVLELQKPLPQYAVLECCSAQLQSCNHFKAQLSIVLNIAPNHLDHHASQRAYEEAKANIFRAQSKEEFLIYNADCPRTRRLITRYRKSPVQKIAFARGPRAPAMKHPKQSKHPKHPLIYLKGDAVFVRHGKKTRCLLQGIDVSELNTPQLENRLAALAAAYALGILSGAFAKALAAYIPRPHRQQIINPGESLLFINDAKSTSVHSAQAALARFSKRVSKNSLIWVTGGTDKNLPLTQVPRLARRYAGQVILLGSFARLEKIFKAQRLQFSKANNLAAALQKAKSLAHGKGIVLFSPLGAAGDLFADYEDRGSKFMAAVDDLRRKTLPGKR